MAFKIVDDPFGQLTFVRIYQGRVEKGQMYVNQRTGRKGPVQPDCADARRQARRNR